MKKMGNSSTVWLAMGGRGFAVKFLRVRILFSATQLVSPAHLATCVRLAVVVTCVASHFCQNRRTSAPLCM